VLFFKTQVQQDVFFGHMLKKTVFNHQIIDLAYMSNQAVMADLVPKFESMRLTNFFSIDVIGMRQLSANSMQP
jgi:hypothetical protein